MSSLNQVSLIGNLGSDPQVKSMQNGDKVANFSLATSERWTDKRSGEKREITEWHRVVIWGNLAEIVEKYVRKGSKIFVQGQLKTRKWTDKQGVERYTTEVVLNGFGSKMVMLSSERSDGGGGQGQPAQAPAQGNQGHDLDGDEIPF